MKERIQECVYRGLDEKLKELDRVEKFLDILNPKGFITSTPEIDELHYYLSELTQEIKQIWEESASAM